MANINGNDDPNVLNGTNLGDYLRGLGGADTLYGYGDNDTLDGGTGHDTLVGGDGNDTYILRDVSRYQVTGGPFSYYNAGYDTVVEGANGGIDTVYIAAVLGGPSALPGRTADYTSYTLGANIERGIVLGSDAFDLTGNGLDNYLAGNNGTNTLSGGEGKDTLNGYGGHDTLIGGGGDDTYTLADIARYATSAGQFSYLTSGYDSIVESAGGGTDTVLVGRQTGPGALPGQTRTFTSYTLGDNVENGTVTGTDAFDLTGNALANVLTGNDADNVLSGQGGSDTLAGGRGNDTLVGGAGDDTYILGDWRVVHSPQGERVAIYDTVVESAGGGVDTVNVASSSPDIVPMPPGYANTYYLGDNVENGKITGLADMNMTGNDLDNQLVGNFRSNTLKGGAGNDRIIAGGGNDTLVGGAGADSFETYVSGFGKDVITDFQATGVGHDTLTFGTEVFGDLHAVLAHAADVGGNAVISLDANNTMTLKNVQVADLTAANVKLVDMG